jgi:hypothetical protein
VQVLTLKFGPLPQSVLDTVYNATTDQLKAWTASALITDSLEQALR